MNSKSNRGMRSREPDEYIQVWSADRDQLTDLVIKAKGPRRSMRQFAFDCNVSPSTLSRLISKKTSGEASDELLYKIAANADPESNVTLDKLMFANGKMKGGEYISSHSVPSLEEKAGNILVNELLKRGYSVRIVQKSVCDEDNLRIVTDAPFECFPLSKDRELRPLSRDTDWTFVFCLTRDHLYFGDTIKKTYQKLINVWQQYYSGEIKTDKISIVVNNEKLFDELKNTFEAVWKRDKTSLILVDLTEERIMREYSILRERGDLQ